MAGRRTAEAGRYEVNAGCAHEIETSLHSAHDLELISG
jgi:hypothetical protein